MCCKKPCRYYAGGKRPAESCGARIPCKYGGYVIVPAKPVCCGCPHRHPPCCMPFCPPVPPTPPDPPSPFVTPTTIEDEVLKIISGISSEELGIADILDAEGDKIRKVIENSNSPEEMIAVNNSVAGTVGNLTELERQLVEKLKYASEIYKENV